MSKPPAQPTFLRNWLPAAATILALALISLWMRPPLPLDETRYLAVAWEMHQNGDWLVPHLNGREYSQKPPLLFWLINAGWKVFGVNAWWPRLLPALAAIATFAVLLRIAAKLNTRSPLPLLLGSLAWPLYSTMLLFDLLMAFFAAVGWLGIVRALRQERGGWTLTTLAMGFGILCKGPVILLYVLPMAILAPFLPFANTPNHQQNSNPLGPQAPARTAWFLKLIAAVLTAAAIALSWALSAAHHGSQAYADDLLWGQTAGRMQNSFSHDHPWWWYFPILLALFLPWIFVPRFWQSMRRSLTTPIQRWFMMSAILPFAVFMLMSGKQPHYLLPLMPLLALALAIPTPNQQDLKSRRIGFQFGIPTALAVTLLLAPAKWIQPFHVEEMAQRIRQLQDQGTPILHASKYHGDFHFLGRLQQPLHVRKDLKKIPAWAAEHPEGFLLISDRHAGRCDFLDDSHLNQAVFQQPYRSGKLFLIPLIGMDLSAQPRKNSSNEHASQ